MSGTFPINTFWLYTKRKKKRKEIVPWGDPTLHCQDTSKPSSIANTNQQWQHNTAETARLCQTVSQWKKPESAGVPQEVLWHVALYKVKTEEDRGSVARRSNARASFHCFWGSVYILSLSSASLSSVCFQQNITCSLSRQLPEKHDMTQLNC